MIVKLESADQIDKKGVRPMRSLLVIILNLSLLWSQAQAQQNGDAPSIRDLELLIGDWTFVDAATEYAGYEYSESGTRSCAYALDEQYIRCVSKGRARGKDRTYVFYINYNSEDERFEMLSMWSNYSRKALYHLLVSDDGRRIDLMNGPNPEEEEREQTWGTIIFQSDDKFIWESRLNKGNELPDHWPVTFRETADRVK